MFYGLYGIVTQDVFCLTRAKKHVSFFYNFIFTVLSSKCYGDADNYHQWCHILLAASELQIW